MKQPVTLVWSFRNRLDVLEQSLITADKYCPPEINFCLIDAASDEKTIRKLRTFANTIKKRKVRISESAYRTTLSQAWNLGMMLSETRYVVFVSSDVEFTNNIWIKKIEEMIDAGYEYVLIENHAVFMLDKKIIPQIGWFDEQYILGPHFDTDYMIKSSEGKVRFLILPNKSYTHYDSPEMVKARKKGQVKDRLPMHDLTNERMFQEKWQSSWAGWKDGVHPPTNISQVKRMKEEIDPHPLYTQQYKEQYSHEPLHKKIIAGAKRIPVKIAQRISL